MRAAAGLLGLPEGYRCGRIADEGARWRAEVARERDGDARCPACTSPRVVAHGTATRTAYHAPLGKPLVLELEMRRLRCRGCGRTFWEPQPILAEGLPHLTGACVEFALRRVSQGATLAQAARECGASENVLAPALGAAPLPPRGLPRFLAVDEVRAMGAAWAARNRADKMACVAYDGDAGRAVEVLRGRDAATVRAWLSSFGRGERERVEVFTSDMWGAYIAAARDLLPSARICIDKFHVTQVVTEAVDGCRRRLFPRPAEGEEGAAAERARELGRVSRALLARRAERAATQAGRRSLERLDAAMAGTDPAGIELRLAYLGLQEFYEWSWGAHPSRDELEASLRGWCGVWKRGPVAELDSAARTISQRARIGYILNAWEDGRTNAVAESLNRTIKSVRRDARGFGSFESFRRRMLLVVGSAEPLPTPMPLFERPDNAKRKSAGKGGEA